MGKQQQQQQQPQEECRWWRSRRRTCGYRTLYVEICFGDRRYRVAHSLSCGLRSDVLGWVGLAKGSAGTKYCTQLANRYVLERLVFSTPTCHLSTITGGIPHSNPDGLTYLIWGFAWRIGCCCVCWRITRLFRS